MKPVVIIAIAVVFSVVAVLGVLAILQENTEMQFREYQQQVQQQQKSIELQNKEICGKLFDLRSDFGYDTPYDDCLVYGHELEMKIMRDECYDPELILMSTNIQTTCELQVDLRYLKAIKTIKGISNEDLKMIETEIVQIRNELSKLYQEYDEWVIEWDKKMKEKLKILPDDRFPLPEIKKEYLECRELESKDPVFEKIAELNGNSCYDKLEENMRDRCMFLEGKYPEYNECFAEITKIKLSESGNLENEENVSGSPTPIQSEEILTLSKIKNDYSECKKNEQYGTGCYDKLKNNIDEYCRMTTGYSYPEYDECFGEITKIE